MSGSALVVWGGWAGHEPQATAEYVAGILTADGFDVVITPDIAALGYPDVGRHSLIVPVVTNAHLDDAAADTLAAAIRAGTGLAGHHCCLATSFRGSTRFHYITGVQWVAHPGDFVDFTVDIARPDDPLMAGIGPFAYHSEQYYLHYDPTIEVLATTTFSGEHDPVSTGAVMPVVFKRSFGEGRVFYSALGHTDAEIDRHPEAALILRRGLNWAARTD
jgi:uncharacterized protein